ncbi:Uncharacterised protein [Chlamydia trachomatis]|nr:Uncharacterised protein [Chlamydia trachomatis]
MIYNESQKFFQITWSNFWGSLYLTACFLFQIIFDMAGNTGVEIATS